MKQRRLRLAMIGLFGTVLPVFGAEPNTDKGPSKQVLMEFAVLEVTGETRALELPRGGVPSNAPNPIHLGGFASATSTGPDLETTVAALCRDARVKILQRPRIQTSDQTPATLFVGQVVSRQSGRGPDGKPLMLGLTLAATPFIHSDGVITLDLHLEQVTRDGSVWTKTGLAPVTTTREAQAKLTVRDRETILMAGLVTPARQKSVPVIRSPKDSADAAGSGAQRGSRSQPVETLLLVRPTLLQN